MKNVGNAKSASEGNAAQSLAGASGWCDVKVSRFAKIENRSEIGLAFGQLFAMILLS
jgi:hypothetical protein